MTADAALCGGSMVDIKCATADIRRGRKETKNERRRKKKPQDKYIMACPIT